MLPHGIHWHRSRLLLGSYGPLNLFPYYLDIPAFSTHLYTVGKSGRGKSTFLLHLLWQLATKGWGCGVLDPHSDLANHLIAYLAYHHEPAYMSRPFLRDRAHLKRVLYLDPSRTDYVFPLNIFSSSYADAYEIAENVVETFKRVWAKELEVSPRFSEILRSAVQILAQQGYTFVDLIPFLTRKEFRAEVVAGAEDLMLRSFFTQQFDRWGREQLAKASPVLNKVSAILFKPQLRCMFGARENRLDLRQVMDAGRILIIDLGGFNDDETQRLLGSLIMIQLEKAAHSRKNVYRQQERAPFFFICDEFPEFMAQNIETLARILSGCRKFRLHLGLAHQTIAQIQATRLLGALENCDLKVLFGTGRMTADTISREVYDPDTGRIKHEVADEQQRERTHPFYEPLMNQWSDMIKRVKKLKHRQILVQPSDNAPLIQLTTPTVRDYDLDSAYLARLKRHWARRDGIPFAALLRQVNRRFEQAHIPLRKQPVYYEPG